MVDAESPRAGAGDDQDCAASGGDPPIDEGPESAGVAHINEHGDQHFGGVMRCEWMENKGRVLRARRRWKEGEIILAESPLKIVQEETDSKAFRKLKALCTRHSDDFDYEPLWYWCALQSLTEPQLRGVKAGGWDPSSADTQRKLLLLHTDGVDKASKSAKILVKELAPAADAVELEKLIQVWVLNCFEYSEEPQGYSTYWYSSFMSHSCFPNAVWHYTGTDHVLRARRNIEVGDEVCISYLPEDGLLQTAPHRRAELHSTKKFWCTCERCAGELDYSRGFRCQACPDGKIFACTPAPGAPKATKSPAVQIENAACDSCAHKVNGKEAKVMAGHETTMQQMVDDLTTRADSGTGGKKPTLEELQQVEEFINTNLVQHVLADLAWEQLARHYAIKRRGADWRRILHQRCVFHEAAYPGLSGAHAWALEAHGDAVLKGGVQVAAKSKKSPGRHWQAVVKAEPEQAVQLYSEALRILVLMFGEDHEYVTPVESKRRKLCVALSCAEPT